MYNRVKLVQIVRVRIVESGGLYVATSADIPPMHAAAFDLVALREAIEDRIQSYFHSIGEDVRVTRAAAGLDDFSTWEVLTRSRNAIAKRPSREANCGPSLACRRDRTGCPQ